MFRLRLALPALALLMMAASQPQPQSQPQQIDVQLSNFKFAPPDIAMSAGQPYVLHLTNTADGGHDFAAKSFFTAADVAPEDRAKIKDGKIELKGGESVDIHLTAPAAGSYEVHCSHFLHASFGMVGKITVS